MLCGSIFVYLPVSLSLSPPPDPPHPTPQRSDSVLCRGRDKTPLLSSIFLPHFLRLINVLTSRRGQESVERQTLYPWVCAYTHVLSRRAAPPLLPPLPGVGAAAACSQSRLTCANMKTFVEMQIQHGPQAADPRAPFPGCAASPARLL